MHPVTPMARIEYLDILRGMSICFIFFANLMVFSGVLFYSPEYAATFNTAAMDEFLSTLQVMFIQGKFYTLFSLLFGIGMVIQLQRFNGDLLAYKTYMRKRLLILLCIAVIHMWVIWLGDIITFYALLGLLLLSVMHWSNKALLTLGIVCIFLPVAHALLMGVVGFYPGIILGMYDQAVLQHGVPAGNPFEQALYVLQTDDVGLYAATKFYDPLIRIGLVLAEGRLFKIFGILCLGVVAGRQIIQHGLLENRALLVKLLISGALLGIPFNIAYTMFYAEQSPLYQLLVTVFYALGVVPLAISYAAALALMMQSSWGRVFTVFVPLGKMALTNYIMQSVLAIILFNGFAFALGGYYGLTTAWAIGVIVLVCQWLFSRLWLHYFKQGPLESAWRSAIPG